MSNLSPFHDIVHDRMVKEFGPPANELGRDTQWTIRKFPNYNAIHVLVNGTEREPAMWVFDPHRVNGTGVFRTNISDAGTLEQVVQMILRQIAESVEPATSISGKPQ
jgi:hypothetical protein